MREFNTAGPMQDDLHYIVPPLSRINMAEIRGFITQRRYFVLHAPRQTGKTSCLLALRDLLNREGQYSCIYANVEAAQASRENVEAAMRTIMGELVERASETLADPYMRQHRLEMQAGAGDDGGLSSLLTNWCLQTTKPVVLLLDEVDALIGDTLISLLRQLRSGYDKRPRGFPSTVVLCGVRDVQDYRIHSSVGKEVITGGSAFNIKAKSLRLGNFTRAEVAQLYTQHTHETGQVFLPEAIALAWELTQGQPWLVNALAQEACFSITEGLDRSTPIDTALLQRAKENIISRRETHLDQLTDKLREPRVRRVIEPILAGTSMGDVPPDDIEYVIDLGLCQLDPQGGIVITNPIYREVLPRVLFYTARASLPRIAPAWLNPDGRLNTAQLLDAFLAFWRQHGQPLLKTAHYHEIAPHLVMMAFLDRVVNGSGSIDREYAVGSGRMNLYLRYGDARLAIELKVWRAGDRDPLPRGLMQLDEYLQRLGLDTGWLVIFDQRDGLPDISDRSTATTAITPTGRSITLVWA